jgi:hypothetical protein
MYSGRRSLKKLEEERYLYTLSPKLILHHTTSEFHQPLVASTKPTACPARPNKKREEHKEHYRVVTSSLTPPRTVLPKLSPPLPLDDADFLTKDWKNEFNVNPGEHPTARILCIMGLPNKGRLYPSNEHRLSGG